MELNNKVVICNALTDNITIHLQLLMDVEMGNTKCNCHITFSPTDKQLGEIETWLLAERNKTGEGFYCNWNDIKKSYDKDRIVAISYTNKTIGFATYWLTSEKTACIEIAEVMLSQRRKGVGEILIAELLNYLKNKGICVVDLQCAPESSEPFWKRLGFVEFPEPTENYNFNAGENKKLYKILTEHLQPSLIQANFETIELWKDEPYRTKENTQPSYIWEVEFIQGTRSLLKPIIQPCLPEWRMRWRINGKTIKDIRVKRFGIEIGFGAFVIIQELKIQSI